MARHWFSDQVQNPYSKWHRQFDGIAYIDIDAVECCKYCTEPLAVLELTKDIGQEYKTFKLTKTVADRLGVPGFVIYYKTKDIVTDEIISFRVQKVSPKVTQIFSNISPKKWQQYLKLLHTEHHKNCNAYQR